MDVAQMVMNRPRTIPTLDKTNPLAKNLLFGYLATRDNQYVNFVKGAAPNDWSVDAHTREGPKFAVTQNISLPLGVNDTAGEGTVAYMYRADSTRPTGSNNFICDAAGSDFLLNMTCNVTPAVAQFRINGINRAWSSLTTDMADGDMHIITVTYHSNAGSLDIFCYVDGVLEQTISASATNIPTVIDTIHLGSTATDISGCNGTLPFLVWWDRRLSPTEIVAFQNDPWQIFKPEPRFAFTPVPTETLAVVEKPW